MSEKKKIKRQCTFRSEWQKDKDFEQWLIPQNNNENGAHCKICVKNFSIAHGGVSDVRQHAGTQQHKANRQADATGSVFGIRAFFPTKNTTEAEMVRVM